MSLEEARAVVVGFTLGKVVVDIHYAECCRGTLLFSNDRLIGIIPKRLVATADGVKIGDSLATAAAIYGPGSSGSDASGAFQSFPTAPGSDTDYSMYSVNPTDTATKIVPDPGPAANWAEGCNVRFLATAGVGHSVSIVVGDAGKVTGFVVNAGSPLAPMLPVDGAAATLDAVRTIYPDARSTSSSDPSYLAVNYLTLTSGSQKIWLVADYIEANNPTIDRVGDIQIGSGPHIT